MLLILSKVTTVVIPLAYSKYVRKSDNISIGIGTGFRINNILLNIGKKEVVDLDNLSPGEMKAMLKRMLIQS